MNIRNCKKCKKLFNYVTGPNICPTCKAEVEQKFQEVKQYIQNNERSDMQDVSDACDVEVAQIQQWIREERLLLSYNSPMGIECERCGSKIMRGRFCEKCKSEMTNDFNGAIGKNKPTSTIEKKESSESTSSKSSYLDKWK